MPGDEEWRSRVDDRLASLTSGETVQNDRLDEVDEEIEAIRVLLEGNPKDRGDNGVKGDVYDLSKIINELRAIMMPDNFGHGGVASRLRTLEKKAGIEQTRVEYHWKFLTAVAVAVITTFGLLVKEWPDLKKMWAKESANPLDAMIEKAKHPKPRHHHYTVKTEGPENNDPPSEP